MRNKKVFISDGAGFIVKELVLLLLKVNVNTFVGNCKPSQEIIN